MSRPVRTLPKWNEDHAENCCTAQPETNDTIPHHVLSKRVSSILFVICIVLFAACITEGTFLLRYQSAQRAYEHDLDLISDELEIKSNQVQFFLQDADIHDRLGALQWDTKPANAPPIEQQYQSDFMQSRVKKAEN